MKFVVTRVGAVLLSAGLIGCNTLEGFGKDLTQAGNALSGAASKDDKKAQQSTTPPPATTTNAQPQSSGPAPAPQKR